MEAIESAGGLVKWGRGGVKSLQIYSSAGWHWRSLSTDLAGDRSGSGSVGVKQ